MTSPGRRGSRLRPRPARRPADRRGRRPGRTPGRTASTAPSPRSPTRSAAYTPPPPTVSPDEQAVFGRPAGAGAVRRRRPRIGCRPRHVNPRRPVRSGLGRDVRAHPHGDRDGFDPAPGTRIAPAGRPPESPWWKADAHRDPWRDPRSPSWLGRPAVFAAGRLEQLDPDADTEHDDDLPRRRRRGGRRQDRRRRTRGRAAGSGCPACCSRWSSRWSPARSAAAPATGWPTGPTTRCTTAT